MKMTYLLNMTADEYFWRVFLCIVIAFVVVGVITAILEAIFCKKEREAEKYRRALKRYNAPIRSTRRY